MGAGGVGGYFGAKLAQGGHDVAFVARGRHLAAIRDRGLTVKSANGGVRLATPGATDNPATCPRRPPNPQTIGQPESKWQTFGANGDYRMSDKVSVSLVGDYSNRDMDKYFFSGATQLSTTVYNSQRGLQRYTVTPEINFTPNKDTSVNLGYTYGRYNRDETQRYTNRPANPVVAVPRAGTHPPAGTSARTSRLARWPGLRPCCPHAAVRRIGPRRRRRRVVGSGPPSRAPCGAAERGRRHG